MAYEDTAAPAGEPKPVAPQQTGETDDKPEVDPATKKQVEWWLAEITKAKHYWRDTFKQIKENQDFAYYGADKPWVDAKNYTVPILPRHINQTVSQLYAKNPRVSAKRRRKLMYKLWDGRTDTIKAAMDMAQMGDPNAMALLQEILGVRQQNLVLDRLGKTLEITYEYFLAEQAVNFKQQLKAAVRRAKVNGVAYIKIGFQRILEMRPEITSQIEDTTSKMAQVEYLLKEASEGEIDDQNRQMAELKSLMADLQNQQFIVAREGLVFDFPKTKSVIHDPAIQHLKSMTGSRWWAHEFEGPPSLIEKIYGVDVGDDYTRYRADGKTYDKIVDEGEESCARWYEIEDKQNKQKIVVCEGYCDFLKPPGDPDVYVDRFWTLFPIVFNETEHDEKIFPPSDVQLAKDIQNEYNRSREALREHRIAARPGYVEGGGMSEEEKLRMANHKAHEIITVPSLGTGEDIAKKLQRLPVVPIDPNLYEVEMHFSDLLRTVGTQEANLGGTAGNTATESSIAENSRGASMADNVDDLDEVLSELAHAGGQILLAEMSKDKVVEIAGDGAVWPEAPESRQAISQDLYLDIKAGSSGRPNKASELANMERAMPTVLQLPGVNPEPLVAKYADYLDIDVEEFAADSVPSITAINALMARAAAGPPGTGPGGPEGAAPTGDPSTDPNQQGGQGGQNAPNPATDQPGPQPAMPSPMPLGG